jgi:hypothetical protein
MALILKKHFLKMRYPFRKIYPNLRAVMLAILVTFGNRYKKIKKYIKPSRCVMLCDLDARRNNRFGILQVFLKNV